MRFAQTILAALALSCAVTLKAQAQNDASLQSSFWFATTPDAVALARLELVPEASLSLSENWSLVGSARLRLEAINDYMQGNPPDLRGYSDISRPQAISDFGLLELRDFYLDYEGEGFSLRLGKQQIVWGQLDGFKLADQVNPQSFEQFILEDFDSSRIGLWSAQIQVPFGDDLLEVVITPDDSVSELPDPGDQFFFTAGRFNGQVDLFNDRIIASEVIKAGTGIGSGSFAGRFTKRFDNWDIAFSALHGLDYFPVFSFQPQGPFNTLERRFNDRTLLALSGSATLGDIVLRSEVGFYPSRSFNTRPDGQTPQIVERDQMTLAIAADTSFAGNTFVSVQIIYDQVFNAPEDLTRPSNDLLATIAVQKPLMNDLMELDLRL